MNAQVDVIEEGTDFDNSFTILKNSYSEILDSNVATSDGASSVKKTKRARKKQGRLSKQHEKDASLDNADGKAKIERGGAALATEEGDDANDEDNDEYDEEEVEYGGESSDSNTTEEDDDEEQEDFFGTNIELKRICTACERKRIAAQ